MYTYIYIYIIYIHIYIIIYGTSGSFYMSARLYGTSEKPYDGVLNICIMFTYNNEDGAPRHHCMCWLYAYHNDNGDIPMIKGLL